MRRIPVKELLLALWVLTGAAGIGERIGSLGASPGLILYAGLFGLLLLCLLAAAYVRSLYVRLPLALILAASAFYLVSFERITSEHMTYDAYINMLNSAGFAGDAVAQHGVPMLSAFLLSALLFAGIAWPPRRALPKPMLAAAAPAAGVALLAALLFVRGGEGARGLPAPFTPLAYSTLYLYEAATGSAGPREPVRMRPSGTPPARDIVLIVDESVAGQYLDINNPAGVRSGLAGPRAGVAIHNYGYAASIANCSVGTNVTLRFGGTRGDYRRINAVMPSIWDYARAAGFATVYIDAQRTAGGLHNLMGAGELAAIGRFVQLDGVSVRDRDHAAADRIAEALANDRAEFILVNKVGAHFPVHDKYPDSHMRYRPALPRGGHEEISDTGSREGFGGGASDWVRYRNAYRNTLLWNVGGFFDRLFARAPLGRATILYTSDHGQDLHERGTPGLDTHCSSDPVMEEGLVPLVVVEGGATLPWERHLAANRNRVSHYQIFPTLLALMGYDESEIRPVYGDSLVAPSRDPFTFNARFNARLGLEPSWQPIDLGRIAPPPPADAAGLAGR